MKRFKAKRGLLIPQLLLLLTAIIYACGGSGGGGSSGDALSGGSLYITDSPVDGYKQVIVTIYKVEFVNASDGSVVTVFDDPLGITYDLKELSGILTKLPNVIIPVGTYSGVYITVSKELILVDNTGTQITPNPQFDPNAHSCTDSTCTIVISGSFTVGTNQPVILDFDLKQFDYSPNSNTVIAKVVLYSGCSNHRRYVETKDDDYELKGVIKTIGNNSLTVTLIKAEHFNPGTHEVTITVDNSTTYKCDDDDKKSGCSVSSFSDLSVGMKIEVHGIWDSTKGEFRASKIEVDDDGDIKYTSCSSSVSCTGPERSISEFTNLVKMKEMEGYFTYTFDKTNYILTIDGIEILITKETRIKDETSHPERIICADQIPNNSNKIEVEYYMAKDSAGNEVYVAYKIEFES